MFHWAALQQCLHAQGETGFSADSVRSVAGGSINQAYVVEGDGRSYFVKLNAAGLGDMFAAEAEGLRELAAARAIRVPRVIGWGECVGHAYLVLEYLPLQGRGDARKLGEQLAALHRVCAERYGWWRDNTIGATPQDNTRTDDWVEFWRRRRLGYQLDLAARNGHGGRLQVRGERLLEELPALIGHAPPASLLHGDLWSGNQAYDGEGEPVIFDPAVYYGDRETDLAMTELFGAFPADFYAAYEDQYPLDPDYRVRKTVYNLYHVINHLNLFGRGYLAQTEDMIDRLLAQVC